MQKDKKSRVRLESVHSKYWEMNKLNQERNNVEYSKYYNTKFLLLSNFYKPICNLDYYSINKE